MISMHDNSKMSIYWLDYQELTRMMENMNDVYYSRHFRIVITHKLMNRLHYPVNVRWWALVNSNLTEFNHVHGTFQCVPCDRNWAALRMPLSRGPRPFAWRHLWKPWENWRNLGWYSGIWGCFQQLSHGDFTMKVVKRREMSLMSPTKLGT